MKITLSKKFIELKARIGVMWFAVPHASDKQLTWDNVNREHLDKKLCDMFYLKILEKRFTFFK